MIKIFTGDDRVRAKQEIAKFLGPDYEVIEGIDISPNDMPSIFLGNSLFSDTRNILIRDLSQNREAFAVLPQYLETPHHVALLELKLDKRSATFKDLKDKVEITNFSLPKNPNLRLVFDIYKTAKQDGKKALDLLQKIKSDEDPMMFFGLLVSQALKDFSSHQGSREKRILKSLARTDLALKSTSIDPWLLIESLLLSLSKI